MKYYEEIVLKDGRLCHIEHGTAYDAKEALELFILTHEQTDWLLSYRDEITMSESDEAKYLQEKSDSDSEIELVARVDGKIVGMAGIDRVGAYVKVKRRCEMGVCIAESSWGLGIGRALTRACIACARKAGYAQVELNVVAENKNAMALYRSEGFIEYGRNPRGFFSRLSGWQELVLMRLPLDDDSEGKLRTM